MRVSDTAKKWFRRSIFAGLAAMAYASLTGCSNKSRPAKRHFPVDGSGAGFTAAIASYHPTPGNDAISY